MSQRFSIDTIKDPKQLYPLLQRMSDALDAANRRIADLQIAATQPPLSLNSLLTIRDALQSGGPARLNVAQLPGILSQSQRGFAVVAATAAELPSPALYEVGTLGAVLSGTTLTFYLVAEGMPRTWVAQTALSITAIDNSFTIQDDADGTKRIRFEAGSITTGTTRVQTAPDTDQILAGRNVDNSFSVSQAILAALAGSLGLTVTNSSADATAQAFATYVSDGGSVSITARSAANTGTLFGLTLADAATLVAASLANGLFVGTSTSAPVRFGTNNVLRGTIDASTGLWTLSVAGKTLLIKPPTAPAANTLMFEIQTDAGVSVASIDIEGDAIVHALSTTADSTITGGGTALTVNGTNAASGVVVFDVKYSGSTVLEVTGDGDAHLTGDLDVDLNLNVDGAAQIDGATIITGMTSLNGGAAFAPLSVSSDLTLAAANVIASVNTNAARAISLPPTPTSGQLHFIKDSAGTGAGTNNITVSGNGNNIDGAATHVINVTRAGFFYFYDGSQWIIK